GAGRAWRRRRGATAGSGRRCADLGRHRRRLRPRPAAGGRRKSGCAGIRPGCRPAARPHIDRLFTSSPPPGARLRTMASIEVYTTPYCPYCISAKELLRRKGAEFVEINVAGDRDLRARMVRRAGGRMTVPQIFIGETHVGGCDDLYALDDAGGLDPLLANATAVQT